RRPPNETFLLSTLRIRRLDRRLRGSPPVLVLAVPADRPLQSCDEVRAHGAPAQLLAQPGRVDGVAQIVAGTVRHEVEVVPIPPEQRQQQLDDLAIGALAVRPDEVGPTDPSSVD